MNKAGRAAIGLGIVAAFFLLVWFAWPWLSQRASTWHELLEQPAQLRAWLLEKGSIGAPLVFIAIQIAQVVLAPIPGEASSFLGGYLFGTWPGFFYSSLGLAVGSLINFGLGRFLGRRVVDRFVPAHYRTRLDGIARHQGVLVFLIFFLFPGFPKDYLCIFIGLTPLPTVLFLLLAGLGRMPGTFMLSIQGAQVLDGNYVTLLVLVGISLAVVVPVYLWRHRLYAWVDKKVPPAETP